MIETNDDDELLVEKGGRLHKMSLSGRSRAEDNRPLAEPPESGARWKRRHAIFLQPHIHMMHHTTAHRTVGTHRIIGTMVSCLTVESAIRA
jgi:hypothetical protein